ncbi:MULTISPECIES: hypothetical protein [Bacillaceae]|uniref:hypothetical protein n=1 Tax=Bacillaceae TaxID=186817 RepID=UPI001E518FF0|nr:MULTISPECIES: hypothetical protein [Bacillaceae]MCE4048712.1 hypothetical protein [Bacillus sp. Au-Bac7]MCM3032846.1 hypothetical protein [Niallia sp. MER 6]
MCKILMGNINKNEKGQYMEDLLMLAIIGISTAAMFGLITWCEQKTAVGEQEEKK